MVIVSPLEPSGQGLGQPRRVPTPLNLMQLTAEALDGEKEGQETEDLMASRGEGVRGEIESIFSSYHEKRLHHLQLLDRQVDGLTDLKLEFRAVLPHGLQCPPQRRQDSCREGRGQGDVRSCLWKPVEVIAGHACLLEHHPLQRF